MSLSRGNINGGGISSIMGDRYVKSDENKKTTSTNANYPYG